MLLFTPVGACQGTEAIGGISSSSSLLMQSRCSNLDAVQPYCFLSRLSHSEQITQVNNLKILAVLHQIVVWETKRDALAALKWLYGDVYVFCLTHAWIVRSSARQKWSLFVFSCLSLLLDAHGTVVVWTREVISGLNASFSLKLCSFLMWCSADMCSYILHCTLDRTDFVEDFQAGLVVMILI